MAALQYVDVPGYAALILRRNFKQLDMPGALMSRSKEWLGDTDARWHQGRKTWTFPSGATLTFGYLGMNRDDRRQYESAEFQFIGLDELTAFDEDDYRFMFSRLRRLKNAPVPVRMRSASNPGGRGHSWVKRRFIDAKTRNQRSAYIPALHTDNPHIDQEQYLLSLQELHPTTWQRLALGDWEIADPGEVFQPRLWLTADDFLPHPPSWDEVAAKVRYWDMAASEPTANNPDPDYTCGVRMSRLWSGLYVIEDVIRVRKTPGNVEKLVASTARDDGDECEIWMEQEGGASGKQLVYHYQANVIPDGYVLQGNPARGTKGARARPLAATMQMHRVKIVDADWNDEFFDELEAFSEDPSHSGAHDDQVDAGSGAFGQLRDDGDTGSTEDIADEYATPLR